MDDFFYSKRRDGFRRDPFFDDTFFPPNYHRQFNPFAALHESMSQIHREMDEMMRHAFGNLSHFDQTNQYPSITHPQYPSITENQKDQDLDKQVQKYGLENVLFDDSYRTEWDFVKQLEQLEKDPKTISPSNPNMHYYGRSHVYNYRSDGTGRVEERKMVQDSKGNRMESIKKQLDDKIWAKTVRRNEKGEIDEDEKLVNMNDDDRDQFLNEWRSNRHDRYVKALTNKPEKVNDEKNPTQFTLPSLQSDQQGEKSENGKSWYNKLKFWK